MATQANWHAEEGLGNPWPAIRRARSMNAELDVLRPFPNEEIWLFRKVVDNSALVREADPEAGRRCRRWIALTAAATLVAALCLWPRVEGTIAGYRIEALKQERETLLAQRAALDAAEAKLLDPRRLQELARIQQLVDPAPSQIVHLNSESRDELAYRSNPVPARQRR